MLDYSKNTPAIPQLCKSVADRIVGTARGSDKTSDGDLLNQMTVNEYFPGQGIASHTGREFSISMQSCSRIEYIHTYKLQTRNLASARTSTS